MSRANPRGRRGLVLGFGALLVVVALGLASWFGDGLHDTERVRIGDRGDASASGRGVTPLEFSASPDASAAGGASRASVREALAGVPHDEREREAARLAAARSVLERDGEPVSVSGRIVDVDGAPIVGAQVRLLPDGKTLVAAGLPDPIVYSSMFGGGSTVHGRPLLEALPRVVTDADGAFVLAGALLRPETSAWMPAGSKRPHVARLVVTQPGCTTRFEPLSIAEVEVDAGELVLAPEARIVGRLVDDFGAPVEGASVAVTMETLAVEFLGDAAPGSDFVVIPELTYARSDADGRFELAGLWAGSRYLSLSKPGRVPHDEWVEVSSGERVDLGERVLSAGESVAGRVVDSLGSPVAGAEVFAVSSLPWGHAAECTATEYPEGGDVLLDELAQVRGWRSASFAETDAVGRFAIGGIDGEEASNLSLYVVARGQDVQRVDDIAPGRRDVLVSLQPEARLELAFVDARDGSPVSDVTFRVERMAVASDSEFDVELPALDGEDAHARDVAFVPEPGRWLVPGTGPVGTRVSITGGGWARTQTDLGGQEPGSRVVHVVALEREATLSGVVLAAAGGPVGNAHVSWMPSGSDDDPRATERTTSDSDGRFAFTGLRAGSGSLVAQRRGHASCAPIAFELRAGDVLERTLTLRAAARLDVVLRDPDKDPRETGLILESAGPVTADGTRAVSIHSSADAQGVVAFADLSPGSYRIVAPWTTTDAFAVAEGETATLELVRPARPRVHGRITSGGESVRGVSVDVGIVPSDAPAAGEPGSPPRFAFSNLKSDVTLRAGEYTVLLPFSGRFALTFRGRGIASPPEQLVEVVDGDDIVLDVDLPTGGVSGVLVDAASGSPIAKNEVVLCGEDDRVVAETKTDDEGRFAFEHVGKGTWRIFSEGREDDGRPLARRYHDAFELADAERLDGLRLEVPRAARLHGRAFAANGVPSRDIVHAVRMRDGVPVASSGAHLGWPEFRYVGGTTSRAVVTSEEPNSVSARVWGGGEYAFGLLEPGEWRVAVVEGSDFDFGHEFDRGTIDEVVREGFSVVLRAGDDVALDVRERP